MYTALMIIAMGSWALLLGGVMLLGEWLDTLIGEEQESETQRLSRRVHDRYRRLYLEAEDEVLREYYKGVYMAHREV